MPEVNWNADSERFPCRRIPEFVLLFRLTSNWKGLSLVAVYKIYVDLCWKPSRLGILVTFLSGIFNEFVFMATSRIVEIPSVGRLIMDIFVKQPNYVSPLWKIIVDVMSWKWHCVASIRWVLDVLMRCEFNQGCIARRKSRKGRDVFKTPSYFRYWASEIQGHINIPSVWIVFFVEDLGVSSLSELSSFNRRTLLRNALNRCIYVQDRESSERKSVI